MTTWGRIVGGRAIDIVTVEPTEIFHEDVATQFQIIPDGTQTGSLYEDGQWTAPAQDEQPAQYVRPPTVSAMQFKLLFTVWERVAMKESADPIVSDFFAIMNDPRLTEVDLGLGSTRDVIDYMADKGLIAEGRQAQILAGTAL